MAHDVFISYASSDKAVADAVCSHLESIHRIRCWIAPRDVTPGASWAESIIDALDNSKIMILIFSSNANASMQIEREVERAVHKSINIIPLRIENTIPTKTLEYFISAPHWLDALSVPLEQHIDKLASSVKALLAKQATTTVAQRASAAVLSSPAMPPASVAVPKMPMPPPAPAQSVGRPRFIIPILIVAVLGIGVIAMQFRSMSSGSPTASDTPAAPSGAAADAGAATTTPAATTPTATMPAAPPPAPAATPPVPLAASTAAVNPAATATSTSTSPGVGAATAPGTGTATVSGGAAAGASARLSANPGRSTTPVRNPNFAIDLDNNLPDDGSVRIEIDGTTRWTEKGGDGPKSNAFNLPAGPHDVTVTLLTATGEVKETKSAKVSTDVGILRTMKVRLSRFRRNLEMETVVTAAKPAEGTPAAATPTSKPTAASGGTPASNATAPGGSTTAKPSTAKPSATGSATSKPPAAGTATATKPTTTKP